LRNADEVFLTGTAYEITPVRSIDDTAYRVGAVTRTLIAAFQRLVRPHHADGASRVHMRDERRATAPASPRMRLNEGGEPVRTDGT
jgi:hypothetical protein